MQSTKANLSLKSLSSLPRQDQSVQWFGKELTLFWHQENLLVLQILRKLQLGPSEVTMDFVWVEIQYMVQIQKKVQSEKSKYGSKIVNCVIIQTMENHGSMKMQL